MTDSRQGSDSRASSAMEISRSRSSKTQVTVPLGILAVATTPLPLVSLIKITSVQPMIIVGSLFHRESCA
ncbi:MAG: hypothetical protein ACD_75C02020G0004 [uncultured bacterium]|nr:MAG: hypothetical protein ACD_75C02020G0004 [uncultured bacterium]